MELKEIMDENKESNHEFTSIISSQREEIETLRKCINEAHCEVSESQRARDFYLADVFLTKKV
jgi:hypothetical protein